ncbi:hypothetical protein [uncultured Oxalicibacterium sp.]|uniref:hypothetical protein n=1 Tax=uncultured Oxalicibacterium sp. TaxID=1168540 RepID=UPI0025D75631|nr:hypothetical protein [uncultured Oxalicibacterium sp.]
MAETANIAEIAPLIAKDIFKHFLWQKHKKHDENFECSNPEHVSEGKKIPKKTHPGDVVFHYEDPYLGKTIYLHTDLKSYAADTLTHTKIRSAFKSLVMTIECARQSESWRETYSVLDSEPHEVRGLLFMLNHDNAYAKDFYEEIQKTNLTTINIPPGILIHYLGPYDIQRLYSIGNDIMRLKGESELPADYTFYYPDLVMVRRHGDGAGQAATIESITGPFLILKHAAAENCKQGFVIYYNRNGDSVEEFEYFLDCLSRFQMLEPDQKIRIRLTNGDAAGNLKSVFEKAKKKYVKAWGFDPGREQLLNNIDIDRITSVTNTYNPGDMGWRE